MLQGTLHRCSCTSDFYRLEIPWPLQIHPGQGGFNCISSDKTKLFQVFPGTANSAMGEQPGFSSASYISKKMLD